MLKKKLKKVNHKTLSFVPFKWEINTHKTLFLFPGKIFTFVICFSQKMFLGRSPRNDVTKVQHQGESYCQQPSPTAAAKNCAPSQQPLLAITIS